MSQFRISIAAAAVVVATTPLASPAMAQQAQIEEVEVLGRRVNLVGQASSASEGRVSQEELELRPLLRTGEIMETVPGMVATQHSGSGKANQYFLRGFNLDHGTDFATSVNGMPVNMRSHGHGQGYTDLSFVIPETVEEIVYRKGSHYASTGDFSAAGSASISSLNQLQGNKISIGLGEDAFRRILLLGETGSEESQFFYGLETQSYDGPWSDISEDVNKTNVWLKQQWQDGDDRLSLTFMGYDNEWNSADQIPARAVKQGIISELGSIDTTLGGSSSRYSVSVDWLRRFGDGELQAVAYAVDYDLELWSNFTYFTDPSGDQFQQSDQRRIYGWDIAWTTSGTLGQLAMQNTLGSTLRYDDIAEVGLYNSQARQVTSSVREDTIAQWSLGSYWENQLQWTERLRTVFGLRHEYYDFDVDAKQAADSSTLTANSGQESDGISTASLSVIYAWNDNYEVYASAGQGFHSNDARGVTANFDPVTGEPLKSADPLVDTLGYELGLRTFVSDKLNASIALWQLSIDSELIFVGDEGITANTGVGSQRQGIELTAYYYLNDRWTLDLEYAYTDAEFDEAIDGSRHIPGALQTVVSAGLTVQIQDKLRGQLRLRHFDDYPLDAGARAGASTLANLGLGYSISDNLELNVDILNLFDSGDYDVEYFYESQLPGETQAVADHHFHVFEPRTYRISAEFRF